jgi:hypothetical protein
VPTTTSEVIPDLPETTTEGNNPPVSDTTVDLPPPADTTTEEPLVDTTTEVPIPPQTTTEEAPAQDTTTADQQPAETTTQPEPKPTTEDEAKPTTKEDEDKPSSKEEDDPVITQAPAPTTAPPEATASVSSVSSQIASLIPVIDKWKEDPESLKDETNKEVEDTHDDIIAVIVALGGKPDVGCASKKRGLLGPIGDIINKLACMAEDLTKVSGGIIAGNVPAVTGAVSGVQGKNDELTDEQQDEDEDEDEKSEEKSEEKSTKQEESTQEKSTEASTTTEAPTTTEVPTTTEATTTTTGMPEPCASGSCGGGDSCPMNPGPGKDGKMSDEGGVTDCKEIPTTTTDGPLPTKPGGFKDPFSAPPTSRPEAPSRKRDHRPALHRRFEDDTSPNPAYVASLNPVWVSQVGDASGHWFNAPGPAGRGSAGVNGIYGCTAVMIVSNVGAYLSHIWENPVFIDKDWNFKPDDEFNAKSFEALRDGTADGAALSISSLIGTDENPGYLHSINEPKVFVLTPFTSEADTMFHGITTLYRYEERANALATNIASIIPGSTSQVLGYIRTDARQSTEYGYWGRTIVEFDMLERVIQSAEEDTLLGLGMAMGRWRLWVEDYLVTSHEFFVFPPAAPAAPAGGQQKRADEDAAHSCLIRGDSTGTASSGPTSTDPATSAAETTTTSPTTENAETTETSAGPTTETKAEETSTGPTTETKAEETTRETSAETTHKETTTSDETTTKPPTTLMTSFITTTSAPDTTETDTYTGPYPCVNFGGPRVETPHCQCSTTTAGQVFVTTAALISGQCHYYHEYPSPVTLAPTEAPSPPEPTPFTTTKDDGAILAFPDQTVKVGNYPGGSYTYTEGSGTASTIRPADPVQTDGNNKGSSQCHSIDNACDRAIDNFKDDVIYTEFASYYARIKSGIIVVASFGQAGCVVEFDCDDWSVGGLNGKQIKEEYQYMKDNTGVNKCGSGYMSNTCRVTANYCTNCNERHQQID